MAVTVAEVRQRVAAAVEALTTPDPWRESRWGFDELPQAEPGTHVHLSFAVGVPETTLRSPVESSRIRRVEALSDTRVVVRWVFLSRGDAQVARMDAMLAAEAELVLAALGVSALGGLHLAWLSATRTLVGDGTAILGEVTFTATHQITIAAGD